MKYKVKLYDIKRDKTSVKFFRTKERADTAAKRLKRKLLLLPESAAAVFIDVMPA